MSQHSEQHEPAAPWSPHHSSPAVPGPEAASPAGANSLLVSLFAPASFEAEQYRTLRYGLEQIAKAGKFTPIVAVTSPTVGDGKTTTAINLAGALGQAPETRVLLVDADLRRPCVGDNLGIGESDAPSLADAILNPALGLDDVVRGCPPFNLSILPAGRPPAAPYEVLRSPRLGELLEAARQRYDYILVDTPPLIPVPDCRLLAKWVDGFLVVVAAHKTPRPLMAEALTVLDPAKVLGLVFNGDDRPFAGYGYAYGYSPSHRGGGWWARAMNQAGGFLGHLGVPRPRGGRDPQKRPER
ncbi:MAG: CpsD/CapB family tyrosine-protein kinase [candidate division NC10 bacterium]|nr:CpsD/CapB family tyrosine-protein kinase [candidate division NC10 bacterium]